MLLPQSNRSFVGCCRFEIHAGGALRGGFPLGGLEEQGTDGLAAAGFENIERDDVGEFADAFREDETGNRFGFAGPGISATIQCEPSDCR